MTKTKKVLSIILALSIVTSFVTGVSAFSFTEMSGVLSIEDYEITTVAPETNHISLRASDSSGKQNINAVEFNPKNPYTVLRAGKSAGYVYSTQTVNTIANNMSDTNGGDTAVAAINGDFFTFGVGVPHGVFIEDGTILSTPPQYYAAFGLTYENEPFIVRHGTILDIIFRIEQSLTFVSGINISHASGKDSLVLYTDEYARSTKTGAETYELRCRLNYGEVRHGDTISFTVEEIYDSIGDTKLGDGYIVLSAQGAMIDELKKLGIGDTREMSFRFNEFWSNVKFAIGGNELLLQNGEIYSRAEKSNQPRTAIGIRPDGTVVMATFDGRQASAAGMNYENTANAMLALGCIDALNLDGGGSTTFVLRSPGAMKTSIVNSVSGASPRQVGNALVLMNQAPTKTAKHLVISPEKRLVLSGGEYSFNVTGAYDENYKPHTVSEDIFWDTDIPDNPISQGGVLLASYPGRVTVSARSGRASGQSSVEIVDSVSEITTDISEITVNAGESFTVSASAKLDGNPVEAAQNLFNWSASSGLGEFTAPGEFKVSKDALGGVITVSLGDIETSVNVTVKRPPVTLTGFEEEGISFFSSGISTKVAPNSKIETDRNFVHDGEHSLKVYYNFLNTTGSVGSYYMPSPEVTDKSAYILSTPPKKLGMFVYGDGSGVTLRSIVEDADGKQHYISYGKIEHEGWKYMEASLPEEISSPIYIKAPVNLVSNPEKLTQGCLYFDRLRAVYTETEEDLVAPTITKAWPDSDMLIYGRNPSVGIILSDDKASNGDPGIDPETVELFVNGYDCKDREYNTETGKISYNVKIALKNGYHTILVRARDKAGNLLVRQWRFEVR